MIEDLLPEGHGPYASEEAARRVAALVAEIDGVPAIHVVCVPSTPDVWLVPPDLMAAVTERLLSRGSESFVGTGNDGSHPSLPLRPYILQTVAVSMTGYHGTYRNDLQPGDLIVPAGEHGKISIDTKFSEWAERNGRVPMWEDGWRERGQRYSYYFDAGSPTGLISAQNWSVHAASMAKRGRPTVYLTMTEGPVTVDRHGMGYDSRETIEQVVLAKVWEGPEAAFLGRSRSTAWENARTAAMATVTGERSWYDTRQRQQGIDALRQATTVTGDEWHDDGYDDDVPNAEWVWDLV